MKITGDDLTDFFNEKGCKDGCLYCSNKDWIIPSSDSDFDDIKDAEDGEDLAPVLTRFPLITIDDEPAKQTMRTLPLICSNCGFVRLQDWLTFKSWMKSRKSPSDEHANPEAGS